MTAPSIGAKDILVTAGVGTFSSNGQSLGGWPIFISKLPSEPSSVIAIHDSVGKTPDPKWLLDYPGLAVMIRHHDYQTCYSKARDVNSSLLGLTSQTINGDRWDSVTGVGGLVFLGRDEKDRCLISINYSLIIEPAQTSYDIRQPL